MAVLRKILLIALALLLDSTFFRHMEFYGIKPDIPIIVLIFIAYKSNSTSTILYGFLLGFFQDVYSPEYLGSNSFTMALMGFIIGLGNERLTVENYSVKTFLTLGCAILHDFIYLCFYTSFDINLLTKIFLENSLPGAVYTSLIALVAMTVWDWSVKGGLFLVIQELFGLRK